MPNSSNQIKKELNDDIIEESGKLRPENLPSNKNAATNEHVHPDSTKLPRRMESLRLSSNPNEASEISEINFKEILDQIIDNLSSPNISQWFSGKHTISSINEQPLDNNNSEHLNLFDSIKQALHHIDFNLKRNSDFINELTKILDTSRSIKQEAQLKKMIKSLEEERNNNTASTSNNNNTYSLSQPSSPKLSLPTESANKSEDSKKKLKTKSFKGFTSSFGSPKLTTKESSPNQPTTAETKPGYLSPPSQIKQQIKSQSSKDFSSQNNTESIQGQLKLYNQHNEVNNSDYIELESEVEKISFYMDGLSRSWLKLNNFNHIIQTSHEILKNSVEFQTIITNLNSSFALNELEQCLFKLNWLITSKSGFAEPNWQTSVFSLTPSTIDSFIGVNLLKNYYRYVKYDFVSYKLFTRQLQLVQICAIILDLIHRILIFYRESITLSTIQNSLNLNSSAMNESSLLTFSFSADKFKPISWSGTHVTLYNTQSTNKPIGEQSNTNEPQNQSVSRSSSTRRGGENQRNLSQHSREESIRQIKYELFMNEINEFISLSTKRLNIQANLANRIGYFYIVNQSTGLVLQAVDFSSTTSLKETIEQHQKRLQNSSIKGASRSAGHSTGGLISKGPRFYLTPKINTKPANQKSASTSSSLSNDYASDEQLWYYYLINGCIANKVIRSGYCMAASSLNAKSPVCFWPNVKTTNCSWFYNAHDQTIVSGLSDDLVLDYIVIDEPPNQRYAVVIDTKDANKASQKWSFEFC